MRIVSWNMRGGGYKDDQKLNVINIFFAGDYDVICLQEATKPLNTFSGPEVPGGVSVRKPPKPSSPRFASKTHPGADKYICYYYQWSDGNNRCSLVTYVKGGYSTLNVDYGFIQPVIRGVNDDGIRSLLWIKVPDKDFIIANVHLPSGAPALACNDFIYLKDEIATKRMCYAIVGDFNMSPDFLEERTRPGKPGKPVPPPIAPALAHFHHASEPTHISVSGTGSILDYCYYEVTGAVQVVLDKEIRLSDHLVLYYTIP